MGRYWLFSYDIPPEFFRNSKMRVKYSKLIADHGYDIAVVGAAVLEDGCSIETICRKTHLSEKEASDLIAALEGAGFVTSATEGGTKKYRCSEDGQWFVRWSGAAEISKRKKKPKNLCKANDIALGSEAGE
jgi:predicted transcriptional regulator